MSARAKPVPFPRVPTFTNSELLAFLARFQLDLCDLTRRVDHFERGRGVAGISPETAGRRRIPLEEAARRGLLPAGRCARTVRGWLATAESRARWKVDLFARRIGNRIEIDLDGLEKWRAEMAAPTSPTWPRSWEKKPS
jgi:hypothetical protein